MGNCFKSQAGDDISELLHDSASYAGEGEGEGGGIVGPGARGRGRVGPGSLHRPPQQEQAQIPVYHPTPSQTRLATQLTEEEQIRIAQRLGLIQHLPKGSFNCGREPQNKKVKECVICMMDFVYGDDFKRSGTKYFAKQRDVQTCT